VAKKTAKRIARKPAARVSKKTSHKAAKKKTSRQAGRSASKQPKKLAASSLERLRRLAHARELDSDSASELVLEVFEAVDKGVYADYDKFLQVPELPAMLWAAWWLEGEVNNGGFDQFFLNKGPHVAARALQFFKAFGPKDVASMLERAIKALPGGKLPANSTGMMNALVSDDPEEEERLSAALSAIDAKCFDRRGASLQSSPLRFVHEHPAAFFNCSLTAKK
jgi:hypothetical protein